MTAWRWFMLHVGPGPRHLRDVICHHTLWSPNIGDLQQYFVTKHWLIPCSRRVSHNRTPRGMEVSAQVSNGWLSIWCKLPLWGSDSLDASKAQLFQVWLLFIGLIIVRPIDHQCGFYATDRFSFCTFAKVYLSVWIQIMWVLENRLSKNGIPKWGRFASLLMR